MDSIKIGSGELRIAINDDPNRVIVFNPKDIIFAEKFYGLFDELKAKMKEYERRAAALGDENTLNEDGLPVNMAARIALTRESCEYLAGRIDNVFGAGTSHTVFGDYVEIEMFEQFFNGITPYFQNARSAKLEQYSSNTYQKRRK
jgi:hypothetical protein